jgi:hypothetical protein
VKQFQFQLEPVLRLYELQLEVEQGKLAQAHAREQTIVHRMRERAEEVHRQNEAIRRELELRSADLRALSTYNLSAQTQQIIWHQELTRARQIVLQQRKIVLAHERKVKLVRKLREKKFAEWKSAQTRQLEAEAHELWLAARTRHQQ